MEAFVGEVRMFAGSRIPRNWLRCDGSLLPVQGNETLFSLTGYAFGGDGRATFAVPDLRGRVGVHPGGPIQRPGDIGGSAGTQARVQRAGGPLFGFAAQDNLQPFLGLNFMICRNGYYPSPTARFSPFATTLGEIRLFAGLAQRVPSGWQVCEGQMLSVSEAPDLFSVIGQRYGGTQDAFALPDLRARVPVHIGSPAGTSGPNISLGQSGGDAGSQGNALIGDEFVLAAPDNYQPYLAIHYMICTAGALPG